MNYDQISNYLNKIEKLNIIDVGCHAADFLKAFKPTLISESFWIGIDPLHHTECDLYDIYINKAVDNVETETDKNYYMYALSGCNSLLPLNKDHLTHDRKEFNDKWFVIEHIEADENIKKVKTDSLENIIKEHTDWNEIHFLKIDTKGSDINVVKSLGLFIPNVHIIQMESTVHPRGLVMYKGQTTFDMDIKTMEKLGFSLLLYEDYSSVSCPEVNAIFINNNVKI